MPLPHEPPLSRENEVQNLNAYSIERLISLACRQQIISDYRMTPTRIRLYQDDTVVLESDPEEARFFLQGLLRGCWRATQLEAKRMEPPVAPVPMCWLCEQYEERLHAPDACAVFPKGILEGVLRGTKPPSGPAPCGGKGFRPVEENAAAYARFMMRQGPS